MPSGAHCPLPPTRRAFFDSCDGFFTNYNWHKEHLQRMRGSAGDRLADVYVGVDVFGRGDVVGGGFDTVKVRCPSPACHDAPQLLSPPPTFDQNQNQTHSVPRGLFILFWFVFGPHHLMLLRDYS